MSLLSLSDHKSPHMLIGFLCPVILCLFIFFYLRRKRRGSVSTKMTPHQCWNVCDWETTVKDQPSEAQLSLPTCTQRKPLNQSSDCGRHTFEKGYTFSFQPSMRFTQTSWHKRNDGTPSSQRHSMLKLYQNFERNRPANSIQKDMSFTSFPFCNTGRAQNPNQSRLLSISYISWHNMSRAIGQLNAIFAISQSCKQEETLSPDPCNPVTCNASFFTLPA